MLCARTLGLCLGFVECFDGFDGAEIAFDAGSLVVDFVEGEAVGSVGFRGDGRFGRIHACDFAEEVGIEDLKIEAYGMLGLPADGRRIVFEDTLSDKSSRRDSHFLFFHVDGIDGSAANET